MSRPPVASSQVRAVVGLMGMAPANASRIECRSTGLPAARAFAAAAATRSNMGATPGRNVAGRRFCAARTESASNLGNATSVAPIRAGSVRQNMRPNAWKNGRTP
ncbi:hypothetical protein D3C74_371080 [compost metagenome]